MDRAEHVRAADGLEGHQGHGPVGVGDHAGPGVKPRRPAPSAGEDDLPLDAGDQASTIPAVTVPLVNRWFDRATGCHEGDEADPRAQKATPVEWYVGDRHDGCLLRSNQQKLTDIHRHAGRAKTASYTDNQRRRKALED